MRVPLLMIAALLIGSGISPVSAQIAVPDPTLRSGQIEAAEAQFKKLDPDANGEVTLAEFRDYLVQETGDESAKATKMTPFDADQNQVLTRKEWLDFNLGVFDCTDEDHNGRITGAEFEILADGRCIPEELR